MRYLLDTNTAVNIMRKPRGAAATRFLATSPADLAMSIASKAELLVGPNRTKAHAGEMDKLQKFLSRVAILPFDDVCAEEFGRIAAHLFDAGAPVDGMDIEIAATARCHGLVVVTANVSHFGNVPGLQIENWIT